TYSALDNDISGLGVTSCAPYLDPMTNVFVRMCSPLHLVMNAGFVVMGVLILLGLYLTSRIWRDRRSGRVGYWLLGIGGLGTIASGTFPVNENVAGHILAALLFFFVGSSGIILLGTAIRQRTPKLALATWIVGALTPIAFVLYPHHAALGLPRGLAERVAGYP